MSRIALVLAMSRNGVIGRDGGLPWHIPSELKRFKAITMGKPLIMGRKTWESLPRRPLPGRLNIVISRNGAYAAPGAVVVTSAAAALAAAGVAPEVAVIGGGEIFTAFLAKASRIYLTIVDLEVAGDTHFIPPAPHDWAEVGREDVAASAEEPVGYSVRTYDRRRPASL
jgi:dihydrofolate reductase